MRFFTTLSLLLFIFTPPAIAEKPVTENLVKPLRLHGFFGISAVGTHCLTQSFYNNNGFNYLNHSYYLSKYNISPGINAGLMFEICNRLLFGGVCERIFNRIRERSYSIAVEDMPGGLPSNLTINVNMLDRQIQNVKNDDTYLFKSLLGINIGAVKTYVTCGRALSKINAEYYYINQLGIRVLSSSTFKAYKSGWTAGAGVMFAISEHLAMSFEWNYARYGRIRLNPEQTFGKDKLTFSPHMNILAISFRLTGAS